MKTMDQMELECPGCGALLEIDAGFSGAVCRCFECGTLMTVPADASREKPEQLRRPEAPAPVSRNRITDDIADEIELTNGQGPVGSEGPTGLIGMPSESIPSERLSTENTYIRDYTSAEDEHTPQPARAATHASVGDMPSSDALLYTTASGRRVRVRRNAVIPTAQKRRRRLVKATTLVLLLALAASVIGVIFVALRLVSAPIVDENPDPITARDLFDPRVNPFLDDQPRFFGLKLAPRSVVLLDLSGNSQPWFEDANLALRNTMANLRESQALQIIYFAEDRLHRVPETAQPISPEHRERIQQLRDELWPAGTADPRRALAAALAQHPDQVVLVTSQILFDQQIQDLLASVQDVGASRVRVDVMMVGESQSELQDFAHKAGGQFVQVPLGNFRQWYQAYREAREAGELNEEGAGGDVDP